MNEVPNIYGKYDTPETQPLSPGQPSDYVGVYAVDPENSWVTVELARRFLKVGKVERWFPQFLCAMPPELQIASDANGSGERYFQIWFRGIPSEKGRYGSQGRCIREVAIESVFRIIEGTVPEYDR